MNLKTLLCGVSLLGTLIASGAPAVEVKAKRIPGAKPRNVVFILTDDHRYDAMGFMGHPFMKTPHLDSIAANGVHLKNAFVTTSLCSPSRASILTGLYTHRHRVIDNNRPVPEGTVYFPQYLQDAGYTTAYFGKWHMGDNGFMFGEHGLIDKRVAYETSIRVPMVMQCPDLFKGGTVVEEVVANIDIGPTVLEAAGVQTPPHMDGASFIPVAQGKETKWRDYLLSK